MEQSIASLAEYAVRQGLIGEEERIYSVNLLLELLKLDEYGEPADKEKTAELAGNLERILGEICDYAYENGLIEENGVVYRARSSARFEKNMRDPQRKRPTIITICQRLRTISGDIGSQKILNGRPTANTARSI